MRQKMKKSPVIRAFTLIEMMVVVILILILLAVASLTFFNSTDGVRIKRDAGQTIAFLRNMWDYTKTSASALILEPDFENGTLSYVDPRDGKRGKAEFDSDAKVLAIKLNDRLYNLYSSFAPNDDAGEEEFYDEDEYDSGSNVLYLSEGRGLSRITVIFGIPEEEDDDTVTYTYLTACSLNLITGKGTILELEPEQLSQLMEDTINHNEGQNTTTQLDRDALARMEDGEEKKSDGDDDE